MAQEIGGYMELGMRCQDNTRRLQGEEPTKQGLAPPTAVRWREPGLPTVQPCEKEPYQVCSLQLPGGDLPSTAVCMSPTELSAETTPSNSQEITESHPDYLMWTYTFQQSGTSISCPKQRLNPQSSEMKRKGSTIMLGLTIRTPTPITFYYYNDFLSFFMPYLTPGSS